MHLRPVVYADMHQRHDHKVSVDSCSLDPSPLARLADWITFGRFDCRRDDQSPSRLGQASTYEPASHGRCLLIEANHFAKTSQQPDHDWSAETLMKDSGVNETLENDVEKGMNDMTEACKLQPESIVETAAIILKTKIWHLRGLSNSIQPDHENRSILAFCFVDLGLCDIELYAEYMKYRSGAEVREDAKRGAQIMAKDKHAALRGDTLNSELSRLDLRGFPVPSVSEDQFSDGSYGDNVIRLPIRNGVSNFEELVEAIQ